MQGLGDAMARGVLGLLIGAAIVFGGAKLFGEEPVTGAQVASAEDAALSEREAKWLALKCDLRDQVTFEPETRATRDIRDMLMAIRTLHVSVEHIRMLEGAMPDAILEMTVEGDERPPKEITNLTDTHPASMMIRYGENEKTDPIRVTLYFHTLLHLPSLVEKVSASARVKDAKDGNSIDLENDPIATQNVSAKKVGDTSWQFVFSERVGDLESTTHHYTYFTVELDAQARLAPIQPAVVGHGMKIEKVGEYHRTVGADGSVVEWGEKKW